MHSLIISCHFCIASQCKKKMSNNSSKHFELTTCYTNTTNNRVICGWCQPIVPIYQLYMTTTLVYYEMLTLLLPFLLLFAYIVVE